MKDILERVVCTCGNLKMDWWRSLPMTVSDLTVWLAYHCTGKHLWLRVIDSEKGWALTVKVSRHSVTFVEQCKSPDPQHHIAFSSTHRETSFCRCYRDRTAADSARMRYELSSLDGVRRAFVGELLCSVMCIELGAFLIVSTRHDDERPTARADPSRPGPMAPHAAETNAAATARPGPAARLGPARSFFAAAPGNLFRMNNFEAASGWRNSAKRRNTRVRSSRWATDDVRTEANQLHVVCVAATVVITIVGHSGAIGPA